MHARFSSVGLKTKPSHRETLRRPGSHLNARPAPFKGIPGPSQTFGRDADTSEDAALLRFLGL